MIGCTFVIRNRGFEAEGVDEFVDGAPLEKLDRKKVTVKSVTVGNVGDCNLVSGSGIRSVVNFVHGGCGDFGYPDCAFGELAGGGVGCDLGEDDVVAFGNRRGLSGMKVVEGKSTIGIVEVGEGLCVGKACSKALTCCPVSELRSFRACGDVRPDVVTGGGVRGPLTILLCGNLARRRGESGFVSNVGSGVGRTMGGNCGRIPRLCDGCVSSRCFRPFVGAPFRGGAVCAVGSGFCLGVGKAATVGLDSSLGRCGTGCPGVRSGGLKLFVRVGRGRVSEIADGASECDDISSRAPVNEFTGGTDLVVSETIHRKRPTTRGILGTLGGTRVGCLSDDDLSSGSRFSLSIVTGCVSIRTGGVLGSVGHFVGVSNVSGPVGSGSIVNGILGSRRLRGHFLSIVLDTGAFGGGCGLVDRVSVSDAGLSSGAGRGVEGVRGLIGRISSGAAMRSTEGS